VDVYLEITAADRRALAADKRVRDADGRMHVADCVLTAAQVNPYLGKEVPDSEQRGLQPDRVYYIYRHPDALKAAVDAGLFENLPLMLEHIATTAADPQKALIAGSISNVRWQSGKVLGDIAVWDQAAIDLIESGRQRELSCGYAYEPVLESGSVDGQRYTLVMRNIVPNHCALVSEGRVDGATVHDHAMQTAETDPLVAVRRMQAQAARPSALSRLIPNIDRLR
jgi:uncharacterized protein